jgi:hypothetical protein
MSAAKAHFKAAWKSIKIGSVFFWSGVKALPGVVNEKKEDWRERREGKKREVQVEKRRKLEEKMKREEEEGKGIENEV